MKKVLFFGLFGIFLALGAQAIRIDWVSYNPSTQQILAQISNDSTQTLENIKVTFFVDQKPVDVFWYDGFTLTPNSGAQVFGSFADDGKAHEFGASAQAIETSTQKTQIDEQNILFEGTTKIKEQASEKEQTLKRQSQDNFLLLGIGGFLLAGIVLFAAFKKAVLQK